MHPGTSIAALAGVTTTVSPYLYGLGISLGAVDRLPGHFISSWVLLAGCLALLTGGLALKARRVWDQAVITGGVALIVAGLTPALTERPAMTLAVLVAAIALVVSAWESDLPFPVRSRSLIPSQNDLAAIAARAAAGAAVAADVGQILFLEAAPLAIRLVGLAIAVSFVGRWAWLSRDSRPKSAIVMALAALAGLVLAGAGNPTSGNLVFASAALISIPSARDRQFASDILGPIIHHPAGPLVASFFVLCAAGALLLHVPAASRVEGGIASIDAVFTAVSAVCVTGLIVLDTPNDFTSAGQAVILVLIQLGALGIMAYSAAVIIGLGRRLRIRDESLIASSVNAGDRGRLRRVLLRLLVFTFGCEAAGAAVLGWLFHASGDRPLEAVWRGVFTAVSAFCNAGFALQTDSLIPYQHNAAVLHTVAVLIVLGGLSPVAALAIPRVARGQEHSAQIKLILAVSAALLVGNFLLVAAFEWNNSLGGMPIGDRLHNAWFQSVTLRTAGFNSVAMDALRPVTLLVMMASMFVGGSPGGTAGGIKTTTAAVMILSVAAAVRGTKEIVVFGRRVPTETVDRAAAISTLGLLSLFSTAALLLLTQAMPSEFVIFEAVSALATVGLSIGATGELDSVGKLVVTIAMFAGRVGPLSMFAFLATREAKRPLRHSVEPIDVG